MCYNIENTFGREERPMTHLLVKWFVKDHEQVENTTVRTAYGILASVVGIICNVILFAIKAMIGVMIQSISVTADAFNNLSDAASSIIGLVGVKLASRPADKEHPFGHGRYEYLAALFVAFLVFQVGFSCFKSAISKVLHPEAIEFQWILVAILGLSILVKVWLGMFNRKLGNKINSSVMKATATDAFGDVLVTSATVVSIVIGKFTGVNIDGYMGVIVSCVVLYAGFNIAKETLEPLLGQAVSPETYEKITKKVESYEGIVGSHDLVVHSYGPTHMMATLHAEIPNDMNIEMAHELIDGIERDVLREMDIFLVIHMDPLEINNETVTGAKDMVMRIVSSLEEDASIHDFRMVSGDHHSNLIFDLVVPHRYSVKEEHQLLLKVMERVAEENETYQCVITLEHSYVSNQ